ncbi:MAG: D-glycero-beta-D-manno-heptose 1-phosphate adenylyltransferase [Saprospiraceae bacterium]|nr:D-glycero-beta-D-manno-heptose 1-phosphate adenylyltransferase [Saprospiraceae bacterium]
MNWNKVESKIFGWEALAVQRSKWKKAGQKVVFTNGCFDIMHYGHVQYLAQAADQGDKLIVALNSSASIQKLKGPNRPINADETRFHIMASLLFVDAVVEFGEDTPFELIQKITPDILVKGGDWKPEQIVGSDIVLGAGGLVKSLKFVDGFSTTSIEQKILNSAK